MSPELECFIRHLQQTGSRRGGVVCPLTFIFLPSLRVPPALPFLRFLICRLINQRLMILSSQQRRLGPPCLPAAVEWGTEIGYGFAAHLLCTAQYLYSESRLSIHVWSCLFLFSRRQAIFLFFREEHCIIGTISKGIVGSGYTEKSLVTCHKFKAF